MIGKVKFPKLHSDRRIHRFLTFIIGTLLVLGSFVAYVDFYYYGPGPLAQEKTVIFRKGTGFREIVENMDKEGVIRHPALFALVAIINGDARKFKAGEYKFSAAISPRLIMDMIAHGRVVVHKITVPEGLTVRQIEAMLGAEEVLEGAVWTLPKEGSLLPETYHFVYGDTRAEIVARMQAAMVSALDELWAKRAADLPIASKEEAVVLASIVEKETGVPAERGLVASVFTNRLKKGMKLQSDPTVIYAIEQEKGPLARPLLRSDLAYESPYNTYQVTGLPPAPIANPGREAIAAVLNPPKTDYFYFVATGNGGHNFSATLDGHNDNVKEYKKALKQQKKK